MGNELVNAFPPIDPIDISAEEKQVEDLQSTSDELTSIHEALVRTGGISRDYVAAMESIADDIIPAKYPLNSFTRSVSKTNYQVALEAVEDKQKGVFTRLKDAIIAAFRKAVGFIKTMLKKLAGREETVKAALAKNEAVTKREKAIAAVYKEAKQKPSPPGPEVEAAWKELEDNYTGLVDDYIKGTGIYKAHREIIRNLDHMVNQLIERVNIIENIITGKVSDDEKIRSELEKVSERTVNVNGLDSLVKGDTATAYGLNIALGGLREQRESAKANPDRNTSYTDVILGSGLAGLSQNIYEKSVFGRNLDKLGERVEKLWSSSSAGGNLEPAQVNAINKALSFINREVISIGSIVGAISSADRKVFAVAAYHMSYRSAGIGQDLNEIKKDTGALRAAAEATLKTMS